MAQHLSMEREEGEIKKLNSIGTNIYRKYKTIGNKMRNPIKDFIENKLLKAVVAGQSFKFGEYFNDEGMYIEPYFADICVDDNGVVTVIEQLNGKVYQYDQDGRMLVAFGGLGERTGTFTRPSAIDVDSKGRLYVRGVDHRRERRGFGGFLRGQGRFLLGGKERVLRVRAQCSRRRALQT